MKDECNRSLARRPLLLLLGAILPRHRSSAISFLTSILQLAQWKSVDVRVAAETAKIENQCDVEWHTMLHGRHDIEPRMFNPFFSGCKVSCLTVRCGLADGWIAAVTGHLNFIAFLSIVP